MSKVNFNYNGYDTTIQCKIGDKMEDIFKKFCTKVQIDINSVYFLYDGQQVNNKLTFEQSLNKNDKTRNEMNILVPCFNIFNDSINNTTSNQTNEKKNVPVAADSKSILNYRRVDMINDFVERLYNKILGRLSEPEGKSFWANDLITRRNNIKDVIRGFYQSPEFIGRKLTNEEFVRTLYNSILGREPEQGGLDFWVNELKNGQSRDWVISCFLESDEFKELVIYYI